MTRSQPFISKEALALFVYLFTAAAVDSKFAEDMSRLRKKLAIGYTKSLAPMVEDKPLEVLMSAIVTSVHFETRNQELTSHLSFIWEWEDPRLKWEPDEFGGAQKIHLPSTDIWIPEVTLVNGAPSSDQSTLRRQMQSTAVGIAHNGTVIHWPQIRTKTMCQNADLSAWPAETVVCTIVFAGSVWLGQDHVHFIHPGKDQSYWMNIHTNDDWVVTRIDFHDMDAAGSTTALLLIDITMTRSSTRARHTFVVPTLCVAVLTILAVLLSPDNQERWIYLCFNVLFLMAIVFYEKSVTGVVQKSPTILKFHGDLVILQLVLAVQTVLVRYVWAQQSVWSFRARSALQVVTSYVICMDRCGGRDDEQAGTAGTAAATFLARAKAAAMIPMWFITPEDRLKELRANARYSNSSSDWLLLGLAIDRATAYVVFLAMVISASQNWPPALVLHAKNV